MKQVESIIRSYIDDHIMLPSGNLKERILYDASQSHKTVKSVRWFSDKRVFVSIAAALFIFCIAGTSFAYREQIYQYQIAYREQIYRYIVFSILGYSQLDDDPHAADASIPIGEYGDFLDKEINPGELRRATNGNGVGTSIKDVYIYDYTALLERAKTAEILMPSFIPDGYAFDYSVIGAYVREESELPLVSSEGKNDALLEVFALAEDYENDILYLDVFYKDQSENYLRISVTRVTDIEDIRVVYGEDKQATFQKLSVSGFTNGIIVESKGENKDRVHGVLAREISDITAVSPSDHTKTVSYGAESYVVLSEHLSTETVISVLKSFME